MIVLIVEDEPLTAMALELELEGAGHRVLGPAATVKEAEELMSATRPDIALLDINLQGGGDAVALARRLMRRGVGTLFTSGQIATARANPDAACGLVAKPYDPRTVLLAIEVVKDMAAGRQPAAVPLRLELFSTLNPKEK